VSKVHIVSEQEHQHKHVVYFYLTDYQHHSCNECILTSLSISVITQPLFFRL